MCVHNSELVELVKKEKGCDEEAEKGKEASASGAVHHSVEGGGKEVELRFARGAAFIPTGRR